MTLTNFWWLLIWVLAGGFVLNQLPKRVDLIEDQWEERWSYLSSLLLIAPYIIWAAFRPDHYGDTFAYRNQFLQAPVSFWEWSSYLDDVSKDKGFSVFLLICKSVMGNSDVAFFLLIALIQLVCVALVFRKYSCDYWLSIYVFIASGNYLSWTWNGVRQFLAAAIIFAATGLMIKGRYILTIIIILIVSTLHLSAIIMLPMLLIIQGKAWNKRTILLIIGGIAVLAFASRFTDLLDTLLVDTQYSDVVENWEKAGDDGMNPIRALINSVPALLSIVGFRMIRQENDPLINISVNASIATAALSLVAVATSGIYMGRLPIYVSMYSFGILLPWELRHIFSRDTSVILTICAFVLYGIFFYYQVIC